MAFTKVSTDGVKDDAITAGKIPANAIGASELADNAVDSNAIADNAVTGTKITGNAVGLAALADNAVDTNAIANDAVNAAKIADDAVNGSHLADGAINNTALIADNVVSTNKLTNGTSSNDGKFLRANNGAAPTFETVTSTTINNNANNKVITGSDTANTLEGEANLTYDGSKLQLNDASISQFVQSYGANNRVKTLAGSNFLQLITQNDVSLAFRYATDTGSGSEIMRLNANGLSFDGTNNAASSLDDYEEGQWTPNIQGTGSNNSKTYVNQMGEYTKIGHMVFVRFRVSWSARNTDSGSAAIFGLPYACTDNIGIGGAMAYSTITFGGTSSSKPRDHVLETINNDTGLLIITSEDGETFGNVAASIVWTSSGEVRGTAFYTTG